MLRVMSSLTQILNTLQQGAGRDEEQLILALYSELRGLARRHMAMESPDHTLQPTALVHEVWIRLVNRSRNQWQNRAEFFSAAGEAMRRILVDHARRKQTQKRGGGLAKEELTEDSAILTVPAEELLAVDEALDELTRQDPQVAQLVKLRYYVGMSMPEAAAVLGFAPRTAERMMTFARVWLRDRIRRGR
jgi:RNA polymerase sigma factor (TIGR02999 family)